LQLVNTEARWGLVARIFHWLIAALIVLQICLGWRSELEPDSERSLALIRSHYQFGIMLFGLTLMRASWRLSQNAPSNPPNEPEWRSTTARFVHLALYILLFAMPVSGYIIWVHMSAPMDVFGLFTVSRVFTPPAEDESLRASAWYVHYWCSWALIGLVTLHIAAALWHQLVLRDGLLGRMFP
jgi:cytochrome b561